MLDYLRPRAARCGKAMLVNLYPLLRYIRSRLTPADKVGQRELIQLTQELLEELGGKLWQRGVTKRNKLGQLVEVESRRIYLLPLEQLMH